MEQKLWLDWRHMQCMHTHDTGAIFCKSENPPKNVVLGSRNFLQVRKPTEKCGFGFLSRETNLPDPITTHPIVVYGQRVDCGVVDRTNFLEHVENSPLSCPKFGKKNMLGSKCGFRG